MGEIRAVWNNTRMVVITAMCASLYAAILIPFKVVPIIPGVTEFRPGNAVPVVCSFLFGPAAAWGAAIGNLIGDFFGGLGPGDLFGFAANFLYALVPYRLWDALPGPAEPVPRSFAGWVKFLGVVLLAAALCAAVVGWGLNLLGFFPFAVLANVVLVNNFVVSVALGPFLLAVLYPRVRRGRLHYRDLMPRAAPGRWRARTGVALAVVGTLGALIAGNLISMGGWGLSPSPLAAAGTATRSGAVATGVTPFLALAVAGVLLL